MLLNVYFIYTHTHTLYTLICRWRDRETHIHNDRQMYTHSLTDSVIRTQTHHTHTHTHTHGWRQHGSRGVTQWLQVSTLQHCRDFPPVSSTSIVCASERKQGMCLMRNIMEYVSSEPLVMPYREYGEEYACFSSLASKQHPSMESTSWTLDEWVDMIY